MTVCNMTIEGGGRAGMIAPDETTFAWVARRTRRRRGRRRRWRELHTEDGAHVRQGDRRRRRRAIARWSRWGTNPGAGRRRHRRGARRPSQRGRRARAALHGPGGRHADRGDQARPRLHRLLHELPHRRPARRRRGGRGPQGRRDASTRWSCPGSVAGQGAGRGRGPATRSSRAAGFDWRGAGCSMCLGMNPDKLAARRALRLDLEPQLRGPPGRAAAARTSSAPRWPPPPPSRATSSTSATGARTPWRPIETITGPGHRPRCATTSTPTRSSPSSSSSGSSAPASASSCSTTGPRSPAGTCRPTRSSSPAATSAAAPRREHAPWALEDYGFRVDHRAELRRHLLLQLHEDRAAAGRARPRRTCKAIAEAGERRGRPRRAGGALGRRAQVARSRSTPRSGTACSTASTTSR